MYAPLSAGRGEIVTAFVTYTPYVIIIIIIIILQLSNIGADRNFPPPKPNYYVGRDSAENLVHICGCSV